LQGLALAVLGATAFYLLSSTTGVAIQPSFVILAIVVIGILAAIAAGIGVVAWAVKRSNVASLIRNGRAAPSRDQKAASQPSVAPARLSAGTTFRDFDISPEMVVVPAGRFTMGDQTPGRNQHELPLREVTIGKPIAVGRFPVLFQEWETYLTRSKHRAYNPDDCSWGRGRRPVINVSWLDAQAFVEWLRAVSGKPYRLMSEAEWEYCCRSNTNTSYYTGPVVRPREAHFSGIELGDAQRTVEVGGFAPNAFGLFDMHGNVWEWVSDRWHDNYVNGPNDGSSWNSGNSERRVARGGSWLYGGDAARSSCRRWNTASYRSNNIGFRVAREL
jgi:formylglycine-generating enzyme required for sulfatase activity